MTKQSIPTIAQRRAEEQMVKYNFDLQTIEFGSHFYNKGSVSYLIGFLIFLVKDKKFKVIVEGREFTVSVHYDSIAGWFATTDSYDGPEDKINSNWSAVSREDAFEGLMEKLSEAILEGKL